MNRKFCPAMKHSITIILGIILLFVSSPGAYGSTGRVTGVVIDSASRKGVPYASVIFKSSGWGKMTDNKGRVVFDRAPKADSIIISAMGYRKIIMPFDGARSQFTVELPADGVRLDEVVVRPKKQKYSKKNNPAVDFVNRIRNAESLTDPRNHDYFNQGKYQRITIALNNIDPQSDKNLILKKFDFLRQHIDTSEISNKPILNISSREKISHSHFRRSPKSEKEVIEGVNQKGLDDFLDEENMRILYEDFFSDIDLYQNDVFLLHNKFVSPLSKIAPDFYKFYLTDTVSVDGEECIELSFVPQNSATFGFTGRLYVPVADSTMFIKKVTMNVPKDINLNFIDNVHINQEFRRAPDGSRLLERDDLIAEISVMSGVQGLYFRRNTSYFDQNFDKPDDSTVFNIDGNSYMVEQARDRDSVYWDKNRRIPFRSGEEKILSLSQKMRSNKLYYWGEKIVKIFALGYINTSTTDSKFDIGPVNTFFSHNDVEGYRLRLGAMTTANLNRNLFFKVYGAYGTHDHRWKYGAELEWSFSKKRYHSREYPVHSLRLTHKYDMDMLGQHYSFTNPDNMFLSFKRCKDLLMTYLRSTRLDYTLEIPNGFSLIASLSNDQQYHSPYVDFVNGFGKNFDHFTQSGMTISLRYAPGENFYQSRTQRISISPEVPVIQLTHHYSPKGLWGNMFEINKTELSFQQRYWFSAFGYLDMILKGAHIWSAVPFTNLIAPNANLSYTIQPESFALLNPMEFVGDSYVMADMTYWANGAIFNYIPYLKKLKLREVFAIRGFMGHLSKKNRPDLNPDLFRLPSGAGPIETKPYLEAAVGIDNLFRILRVDYVWRLTYRDRPSIDKGGVRIALHFTF